MSYSCWSFCHAEYSTNHHQIRSSTQSIYNAPEASFPDMTATVILREREGDGGWTVRWGRHGCHWLYAPGGPICSSHADHSIPAREGSRCRIAAPGFLRRRRDAIEECTSKVDIKPQRAMTRMRTVLFEGYGSKWSKAKRGIRCILVGQCSSKRRRSR